MLDHNGDLRAVSGLLIHAEQAFDGVSVTGRCFGDDVDAGLSGDAVRLVPQVSHIALYLLGRRVVLLDFLPDADRHSHGRIAADTAPKPSMPYTFSEGCRFATPTIASDAHAPDP
jgi:hypothetical protein